MLRHLARKKQPKEWPRNRRLPCRVWLSVGPWAINQMPDVYRGPGTTRDHQTRRTSWSVVLTVKESLYSVGCRERQSIKLVSVAVLQKKKKKSETELTTSALEKKKKDPKHTKRLKQRFIIGRNRTKRAHFRGSPLFQATHNRKTENTINSTYLASVRCSESGGRKRARDWLYQQSVWHSEQGDSGHLTDTK